MRDHNTQGFDTPRRGNYTPLWFMAGALAGAAAALLFAPASGRETRAYVGRRSRETADEIRERGREAADEIRERSRHAADEIRERGREAANGLRERGREVMHEAAGRGRELWQEHGEPIVSAMKKEYDKANGSGTV